MKILDAEEPVEEKKKVTKKVVKKVAKKAPAKEAKPAEDDFLGLSEPAPAQTAPKSSAVDDLNSMFAPAPAQPAPAQPAPAQAAPAQPAQTAPGYDAWKYDSSTVHDVSTADGLLPANGLLSDGLSATDDGSTGKEVNMIASILFVHTPVKSN